MADFEPTPSQREAIENRGGALLVSAAAGSGKTMVLTRRLASYILDPEDPAGIDEFLVITYTRAAAAELRGRIADTLSLLAAQTPSGRRLRRQAALIPSAPIGTIHAFCQTLLREYSHALGLAPDFAVADEEKAASLRWRSLQRVMERAYEKPSAGFLSLADTVGAGRDDGRLCALVLSLHGKMQCHPRPLSWAESQIQALSQVRGDALDTPWGAELMAGAVDSARYWAGQLGGALELMSGGDSPRLERAYGRSVAETRDALEHFIFESSRGWDAARAALPIPYPRLGPLRDPEDPERAELIKARRGECKKATDRLWEIFADPSEKQLADLGRTAPAMRALLELTSEFDRQYSKEKRRRSLVDFSDLEHMAAELLTDGEGNPTPVAGDVSRRFREVMVDEYQDVSQVQDQIIRALSGGGRRLFMVGDIKQSIYRFRLADPGIFISKYRSYANAEEAADGQPRRVLLRENFRSRREILDGANGVFGSIMSAALGDVDYDDSAALRHGAAYDGPGSPPEILVLSAPEAGEDGQRPDKVAAEARFTAKKIGELLSSGLLITDRGVRRPVECGDIAVILRSANVCGGAYRREMQSAGLPVLSDQAGGFFSSPEVTVLLSVLAVVDNPRQDVPLIAALRSPLFGFSANELSAIRVRDRDGSFYDALLKAGEEDGKCAAFLETLGALRSLSTDLSPRELLGEIYARLGCMALCCAVPDGAAVRENLNLLSQLAAESEQGGYRGLHRFVSRLRAMAESGREPRAGAEVSGGAVRIMSVHRSKGLEFPVVFYCDAARQFNRSDARDTVLVHPQLGLGPKLTDTLRGVEYPTLARRAIGARIERETLSEEMRLIYVAMTRARERLYITCTLPDAARTLDRLASSAASPMAPEALRSMPSPAHWLISAALADRRRRVSLTLCAPDGSPAEAAAERSVPVGAALEAPSDLEAELGAKLRWSYAHQAAVALPAKISATEIKSLGEADGESGSLLPRAALSFRRPDFVREAGRLTPTERGTAAHLALRYIDLAMAGTPDGVRSELERLAKGGYLSPRERRAVDPASLLRLFDSPIGRRIRAADSVRRELPFTLLCPAERFFPGGEGEEILLQGVIDCLIEEDGEYTVIDYKTDGVAANGAERRAGQYRSQLLAYAWAVERLTGKRPRECVVYFLRCGKAVAICDKND